VSDSCLNDLRGAMCGCKRCGR